MKENKFMVVISVLSLIFVVLGATFSFFSVNRNSDEGVVDAKAAVMNISLDIQPLYTGRPLIPTNDVDILKAFNDFQCVDSFNNGACEAYKIVIVHHGNPLDYNGKITFSLNNIENLNYMLLDQDGNVYVDKTTIVGDSSQSLGNQFQLDDNQTQEFTLIIWLPNYDYQQVNDENGTFGANVEYYAINGSRVSGYLSGM